MWDKTSFFYCLGFDCVTFLIFNFYPNLIKRDGPIYRRIIENNRKQNDLIIIPKTVNYLHARQVYKNRLKNIIDENKIEGLKLVAGKNFNWEDHYFIRLNLGVVSFRGFKQTKPKTKLYSNKFFYSIYEESITGLLPKDFESTTQWNIVSGSGKFKPVQSPNLFGEKSLKVKARGEGLYGYTVFPEVLIIEKPSLAVLIWSAKNALGKLRVVHQEIAFIFIKKGPRPQQLNLIKIKDGIQATLPESESIFADNWQMLTNIAPIDPRLYSLTFWIKVVPNESYFYDGFRFFILPLP